MQPTKPLPGSSASSVRSLPPYNTGRVQIGLAHIRRQSWSPDRDSYALQTALLPRSAVRDSLRTRFVSFLRSFV
jgi:hypothetical protein